MKKTKSYIEFEKEEWELVKIVDFLSTKFALRATDNVSDGPTLTNIAKAIKSSTAFKKTFRNTSLSRLKGHISYLVHRGAINGKKMSCRGIVPSTFVDKFPRLVVNNVDLSEVRDVPAISQRVASLTKDRSKMNTRLLRLIKTQQEKAA
jgi:hypothetical protein